MLNHFDTMGLIKGLSFSLSRAVGISGLKTKIARKTGIPTTRQGLERKIGASVLNAATGKKTEKKIRINDILLMI